MEEGVVRSRFGHFRSFLEVCVVVFVTHVVPFFDKSHFLIPVVCSSDKHYKFSNCLQHVEEEKEFISQGKSQFI